MFSLCYYYLQYHNNNICYNESVLQHIIITHTLSVSRHNIHFDNIKFNNIIFMYYTV